MSEFVYILYINIHLGKLTLPNGFIKKILEIYTSETEYVHR